jgi:hypothetical protein
MLPLQILLSSTSQIDKAYPYSFVWPWLGSGLLTSTGKVIESHSATVSRVNYTLCTTNANVTKSHSVTVNMVDEPHSVPVSKVVVLRFNMYVMS